VLVASGSPFPGPALLLTAVQDARTSSYPRATIDLLSCSYEASFSKADFLAGTVHTRESSVQLRVTGLSA
jgi:hypothetical protein